jgi:ankyrin repeat protein
MNNLIEKKINEKLKNLSSTSSEFFSNYSNKNIDKKFYGGVKCECENIFKANSNNNLELILYILKQQNCCFQCKNNNGDTVLHILVKYYQQNDEIKHFIDEMLNNYDCHNFIDIQNNDGQTPMLSAVMNNELELAEQLELAGADKSIIII